MYSLKVIHKFTVLQFRDTLYKGNYLYYVHITSILFIFLFFLEIEDVVKGVLFLLSDDAAMITGAQLPIDGGYTIQ